jgi:hypothetical protein
MNAGPVVPEPKAQAAEPAPVVAASQPKSSSTPSPSASRPDWAIDPPAGAPSLEKGFYWHQKADGTIQPKHAESGAWGSLPKYSAPKGGKKGNGSGTEKEVAPGVPLKPDKDIDPNGPGNFKKGGVAKPLPDMSRGLALARKYAKYAPGGVIKSAYNDASWEDPEPTPMREIMSPSTSAQSWLTPEELMAVRRDSEMNPVRGENEAGIRTPRQMYLKEISQFDKGYAAGGFAKGGETTPGVNEPIRVGAMSGGTPGRADKLPVSVPSGSFVIPADIVSATGEGNTAAGFDKLRKVLGVKDGMHPPGPHGVGILISDGEFVVDPATVTRLGNGSIDSGHRVLSALVLKLRKQTIKHLKSLPAPAQ